MRRRLVVTDNSDAEPPHYSEFTASVNREFRQLPLLATGGMSEAVPKFTVSSCRLEAGGYDVTQDRVPEVVSPQELG